MNICILSNDVHNGLCHSRSRSLSRTKEEDVNNKQKKPQYLAISVVLVWAMYRHWFIIS